MYPLDQIKSLFKKYRDCVSLENKLVQKGVDKMLIDFAKSESEWVAKSNPVFTSYDILFNILTYIAIEDLLNNKVSTGDILKYVYTNYDMRIK